MSCSLVIKIAVTFHDQNNRKTVSYLQKPKKT